MIIDSNLALEEALSLPQIIKPPKEVLDRQRLVNVSYYSFDEKLHLGQIIVDKDLIADVRAVFELIKKIKFPIASAIPMGSKKMLDDRSSMDLNNTVGFNYRYIVKTQKLSNHSLGRAIDINPKQNPYIRSDYQSGGSYDPKELGTILENGEIVRFFKTCGWDWGGDWIDRKDYMHFEKPMKR